MNWASQIHIYTNNNFLHIGLHAFLKAVLHPSSRYKLCLIDLESMNTLREVMEIVKGHEDDVTIVGIHNDGVISRQLRSVFKLPVNASLRTINFFLKSLNYRFSNNTVWQNELYQTMNLDALSERQKGIFFAFRSGLSVTHTARILGIGEKTCYTHANNISQVMQLKNISELYYFSRFRYSRPSIDDRQSHFFRQENQISQQVKRMREQILEEVG